MASDSSIIKIIILVRGTEIKTRRPGFTEYRGHGSKKVTVVKIFGNQTPAENLTRSTAAICHGHVRLLDQVKNLSKASGGFINVHLWTVWTCLSSPYLLLIPLMPFLVLLDMSKLGIMVVLPSPSPLRVKYLRKMESRERKEVYYCWDKKPAYAGYIILKKRY